MPPALAGDYKKISRRALAKLMHLAKALFFVYKNLQLKLEAIEKQTLSKLLNFDKVLHTFVRLSEVEAHASSSTKIGDSDIEIDFCNCH
ncbi:hypothetical protein [Flavobacterium quisquiliarum]|uniref:Uncharacterized protein n=1 Tax=Flavobacterium quisquiliarum TaxID=1834436 RepID=A0ABV8W8Y3_9FLAO|nr:hypothetical protein [Flavobacterium quisquiliarum]MBW1654141.1 hypothetical protein [Flavobacterium quisquiliarum]NWL00867.1 hypothetical protein [Flavobacterium collinsii]